MLVTPLLFVSAAAAQLAYPHTFTWYSADALSSAPAIHTDYGYMWWGFWPIGPNDFHWGSLVFDTSFSAVSWDNRYTQDVFYAAIGGGIGHLYTDDGWNYYYDNWGTPPSGVWQGAPCASTWGPGVLDVFNAAWVNDTQVLHHAYWENGYFSGWAPIYNISTTYAFSKGCTATSWGWGRIDVFGDHPPRSWWHAWTNDGVNFSNEIIPSPLGPNEYLLSVPIATSWGPGRLDVFATDQAHHIRHLWIDNGLTGWDDWGVAPCSAGYHPYPGIFGAAAISVGQSHQITLQARCLPDAPNQLAQGQVWQRNWIDGDRGWQFAGYAPTPNVAFPPENAAMTLELAIY